MAKVSIFPRYAHDYFEQMLQQYRLLLESTHASAPASIERLVNAVEADASAATWTAIFTLETAYLHALPNERLHTELILMRSRYRDIAGAAEYEAYVATVPADLTGCTVSQLRGELLSLAGRVRYLYTFAPVQTSVRNRLSISIASWCLFATLLMAILYAVSAIGYHTPPSGFLLAMYAGLLGGCLSAQQRVQAGMVGDPLLGELEQSAGWFMSGMIPPLFGAVFALVLVLIFAGGLVNGPLFPVFEFQKTDGAASTVHSAGNVREFLGAIAPASIGDWAKLMTWCFIAGFSERFVPGLLDRFAGQANPASTPGRIATTYAVAKPSGDTPHPE